MNRITKINIALFSILSLITILSNLLKYKSSGNLSIIFLVLFFNLSLGLLIVLTLNKIVKISKRGYPLFLFYLILSSFFYWYIISALLHFYYGSFLSLSGIYFFIATRTYGTVIIFYIGSAFIILFTSFLLYYISRKYIFEKNPPDKILNKKLKAVIILTPIILLVLIIILIPLEQAYESSPIIEIIIQFIRAKPQDISPKQNISEINQTRILDVSFDKKPNFIIIMLEGISAEHMPYYGYKKNITPNINVLAEKSIVFNKSYSIASHSDYSQTSFLSSRYTLINSYRNFFDIDYPRVFIWDILKKYNYNTSYISSQDDNWANMIDYYNKTALDLYSFSLSDGYYDYGSGNARKDYDEFTITKAIDWLNKTLGPFFLYINLQATHHPYSYPENNSIFKPDEPSFATNYFNIAEEDYNASLNRYDNSIIYVDKQIGVLMGYIGNKSLFSNTIIVLTSDHGEILERRHEYIRHGFGVYEEEVRVPLIIYIPNQKHKIINKRVRHIDVIPTLLDMTNLSSSEEFQGKPMTENKNIFLMAQNQNFKIGLIKDDIKYMLNGFNYVPEAYNLTKDPYEQDNLLKNEQDKVFYHLKYGLILYDWYNCQIDYYKEEKWKKGEVITCD